MKAPNLILIADELPELSEALFYAFLSNLAVNERTQLVGIGNFGLEFTIRWVIWAKPVGGYASINVDMEEWETERGWCLRLDGLKSPNFLHAEDQWKCITTEKNLADHRKKLGEKHD